MKQVNEFAMEVYYYLHTYHVVRTAGTVVAEQFARHFLYEPYKSRVMRSEPVHVHMSYWKQAMVATTLYSAVADCRH